MRYINDRIESMVLRRKAEGFSVMRTDKREKQAFALSGKRFCQLWKKLSVKGITKTSIRS